MYFKIHLKNSEKIINLLKNMGIYIKILQKKYGMLKMRH